MKHNRFRDYQFLRKIGGWIEYKRLLFTDSRGIPWFTTVRAKAHKCVVNYETGTGTRTKQ